MAARRYEIFLLVLKIFHSFAGFSTREENFVSSSGHVMFYLLYLHQWNAKPFHLNSFLAAERRYILCTHRRGTLGVPSAAIPWKIGKYRNTVPKMDEILNTNTFIQLYPSRVFVYLKHVGTRNQTQTLGENVRRPWSVERLKCPVIGCPSNFVIDCVIIYH